jgi:hypothetical protein
LNDSDALLDRLYAGEQLTDDEIAVCFGLAGDCGPGTKAFDAWKSDIMPQILARDSFSLGNSCQGEDCYWDGVSNRCQCGNRGCYWEWTGEHWSQMAD